MCFLKAFLALDGIKGKNGTRKYKSFDKTSEVFHQGECIIIKEQVIAPKLSINPDKHELYYSFDIPEYSPLKIYKSLCKMALSMLPDSETAKFGILTESIRDENKYFGFEAILFNFFPGFELTEFTVIFVRRKPELEDLSIPSYQFAIMNSNFMFQIPLYTDDEINSGNIKKSALIPMPTPFDKTELGEKYSTEIDVVDANPIKKHTKSIILKYDSITEGTQNLKSENEDKR